MQRFVRVFAAFLAVGFAGSLSGLSAQETDEKGPETVTLDQSRMGVVTFNHWAHQKSSECTECHHESRPAMPLKSEYQKCTDCHAAEPTEAVMTTRGQIFHVARAESGLCIDCHATAAQNGTEVPTRCRDCHVRNRDTVPSRPLRPR